MLWHLIVTFILCFAAYAFLSLGTPLGFTILSELTILRFIVSTVLNIGDIYKYANTNMEIRYY